MSVLHQHTSTCCQLEGWSPLGGLSKLPKGLHDLRKKSHDDPNKLSVRKALNMFIYFLYLYVYL